MNDTISKTDLIQLNSSYDYHHQLNDKDVEMANIYKLAVEMSRSRLGRPVAGDILMIDGKRAHIEKIEDDGRLSVCEQAYTPFISCRFNDSVARISCNTSGGPWRLVDPENVVATDEKKKKAFCFFGHCGMRANGAVDFLAEVNVFKLK